MMLRRLLTLGFLVAVVTNAQALDAAWPTKPVHLVVAHGPGGLSDALARDLAERLRRRWNIPVVVENRPSAGGFLATQAVAQAPGDGYQLLLQNSALVMGDLLLAETRPQLLFRQIRPVAMLGVAPSILVQRADGVGGGFGEWQRQARTQGGMDVGSCGNGKAQHFALNMMIANYGLNLHHIPYNTCAQAAWGILSGTVASAVLTVEVALPHIRSGKLLALAVTSRERFVQLPQVPSLHELGLLNFDLVTWYGVFAPLSMTPDLAKRLFDDMKAVLQEPRDALLANSVTYSVRNGPEFVKQIEQDFVRYQRLSGVEGSAR